MDDWIEKMNLFFLIDTSAAMGTEIIRQLNRAMPKVLVAAEEASIEREVKLVVRIIQINSVARYIIGNSYHGIHGCDAISLWEDLDCGGRADTAGAIDLVLQSMHASILGGESHPIIILISCGRSKEPDKTIQKSMELAMAMSDRCLQKRMGL